MLLLDLFFVFVVFKGSYGLENTTGCGGDCLKCSPSRGCIKCPEFIVLGSRECVARCPYGHVPGWSTLSGYMGRICVHNGNFLGLSAEALAVLTGILTGAFLCTILISSTVIYLKHRRRNMLLPPSSIESSSDIEESPNRRKEFLKQLETFRPYAQDFLDMLNDTRKQLRELHREGDNTAISAYRPVLRDLAKILFLLNKNVDTIVVPDDWEHICNWAEKTLKRYKRMSEISQPQVAQLINFLQDSSESLTSSPSGGYHKPSTTMSTFKPDQVLMGSSLSLQDVAITNFNSTYEATFHTPINPQWKFEYSLVSNTVPSSEFSTTMWRDNSKEFINSLLMDDDYYMGFRPQDEITTEL